MLCDYEKFRLPQLRFVEIGRVLAHLLGTVCELTFIESIYLYRQSCALSKLSLPMHSNVYIN